MEKIDKIFNMYTKEVYEGVLLIKNGKDDYSFNAQYGMDLDKKFSIGGISKIFTTVCIFKLIEAKKLIWDSKISTYLDLTGLCVIKGEDYTGSITVKNLLFQTSGIPDCFNTVIRPKLLKGDLSYSFDDLVAITRTQKAIDKPGKTVHFSDMNFAILGEIIQRITGKELYKSFKEYIFTPLGLKSTYVPLDETLIIPPLHYFKRPIKRSNYIISSKANGGVISTARELMIFTKAFFTGKLFDISLLEKIKEFTSTQTSYGNIYYGGGLMRLKSKLEAIGHIGVSGSFAFYCKEKDLFYVGVLSQIDNPTYTTKFITEIIEKG